MVQKVTEQNGQERTTMALFTAEDYEALPPGLYIGKLLDIESGQSANSEYRRWSWEIVEGPYAGRKVYANTSTNFGPQAKPRQWVENILGRELEAGEIDGTRYVHGHTRYNDLDEFTSYAAGLYRKDYWANSEVNVEVWLEKDALKGVLIPTVVNECGLGLHVTRGFASITYLQEAAEDIELDGRPTYVYVLTDFDPSGVSIAEKVEEELMGRAPSSDITVERLAVSRDQIERWNLPTRPTKTTDTRARKFRSVHGTDSVELDAIPPDELRTLVRDVIESHMDPWRLEQLRLTERSERETLRSMFKASGGGQPR